MITPFPTFPHGGRSNPFPRGGNKKGGKNEENLKIMKIQKELYSRLKGAVSQSLLFQGGKINISEFDILAFTLERNAAGVYACICSLILQDAVNINLDGIA
jgi:hypothetical protein